MFETESTIAVQSCEKTKNVRYPDNSSLKMSGIFVYLYHRNLAIETKTSPARVAEHVLKYTLIVVSFVIVVVC